MTNKFVNILTRFIQETVDAYKVPAAKKDDTFQDLFLICLKEFNSKSIDEIDYLVNCFDTYFNSKHFKFWKPSC